MKYYARFLLGWCVLFAWLAVVPGCAQTVAYFDTGEEFVGPFPSWKNVKTDYGAKGDGVTDDTAAIQKALDDMKTVLKNDWCVLYFPAGTYRLTDSLNTTPLRKEHHDYLGANLIGEDPATTTLLWDGPGDRPMLRYDAWYCKVSRLTFDGNQGKAGGALVRAGAFSTYCELSDLVFKDIKGIALNLGNAERDGQAEHAVLRCRFLRCGEGISTINWNTLDIYVWYCLFEDCGKGIYNRMGGYQAYENVFLRSTEFDIGTMNGMCLAVVNNTSIGSKTFIWGFANYVRGNKIYQTTDPVAITDPGVLLDNVLVSKPGATGAVVNNGGGSTLAVGNTFTAGIWPIRPAPYPHPNATTLKQEMVKAFDNDPATDFFDPSCNDPNNAPHPVFPGVLQWNGAGDNRRQVVKYTITSGSDAKLDPRDFQLMGADFPGGPWTVLDTQTNQTWADRRQKREFALAAPGMYRVYRFAATANAGGTPGMRVAEVEFLDDQAGDLTEDTQAEMTGRNEAWGSFYEIDEKNVAPETLPTPTTVRLPGFLPNRHRKVFEVRPGTGDDAAELQAQIDAAAKEPAGSKPVVHVPKGTLALKRTVTIPAGSDLQLVGDGVGNGTSLNFAEGAGPVLRLLGPSRASLRDLSVTAGNQGGVDGIVVENADQEGGRVYGNQLNAGGAGGTHMVGAGIRVDGLDRADVTMICGGFGSCLSGVNVRGGPVAAGGGVTKNQVVFLTGASGGGCRLLNVTNGGKLVGEAFWYEGDWDYAAPLLELSAASSGTVSAAAVWWHMGGEKQPMVGLDSFQGLASIVGSNLDVRKTATIELKGDGAKAELFCAGTAFVNYGGGGLKLEDAWVDRTAPPAMAVRLGYGPANSVKQVLNTVPEAAFVRRALAQLRAVRIDLPTDLPPGVTDVKFFRVQISGGDGKDGLRIEAGR